MFLILSCREYLAVSSIEAGKYNFGALTMFSLESRSLSTFDMK